MLFLQSLEEKTNERTHQEKEKSNFYYDNKYNQKDTKVQIMRHCEAVKMKSSLVKRPVHRKCSDLQGSGLNCPRMDARNN